LSIHETLDKLHGFVFRFETWANVKDSLVEAYGAEAESVLFKAAINAGRRSAHRRLEVARDKKEALKLLTAFKVSQNWGKIVFSKINFRKKKGTIHIIDSFEANKIKSLKPICHFFKGYLNGFLSEFFQEDIWIDENKCKAQGEDQCEFIFFLKKDKMSS
tara:strand:- start:406 stop:885 length:480 start_codon:yes stop_codon:yes gene_type:complete